MRCIFPCLQLIYFYMDVGNHDVHFFSLLFGRSETLVLHCLCPAEVDGDRQSTKTEKKNPNKKKNHQVKAHCLREGGSSCLKIGQVAFL